MKCGVVSLLDLLAILEIKYRVVAIDLNEGRRQKIEAIYAAIPADARGVGMFVAAAPDKAKAVLMEWTVGVGCNAVLEVSNPLIKNKISTQYLILIVLLADRRELASSEACIRSRQPVRRNLLDRCAPNRALPTHRLGLLRQESLPRVRALPRPRHLPARRRPPPAAPRRLRGCGFVDLSGG